MPITTVEELKRAVSANGQKWGRSGTIINRFKKLRDMQKNAQDFYDLNYEVEIHKEYRKVKLPTARQMVDTFLSHLPLTNPIVEVTPFKETLAYKKKAMKQQEFFQAVLQHSLNQTEPALPYAAKDIGLQGEAFLKVVYDEESLKNIPKKKTDESDDDFKVRKQEYLIERLPIVFTCPAPSNCYPFGGEIDCRPLEMIEVYNAYVGEIKNIWPDWKTKKKDTDIVVFIEYWNDAKRCFLADGTVVTESSRAKPFEDNPYDKTPYVHVYSGWGSRTSENEPEKKAINIIFEAEELIVQGCRWHAYLDKAVSWASMPTAHSEQERESFGEGGLKLEPGMVTYGGEGEAVKVSWAAQNLPAGILQAIGLNDAMINKVQSSVLKGEVPSGVEAGYPMALMIGEARLQFGVALENLKTLTARALELVRYIVRDVSSEDLPLWSENEAVTLSAKDCEGAFRIKVDFESTSKREMAEMALALDRLRAGGGMSLETELELSPLIDNPEKELTRLQAESLTKHPAIQRIIALKAVRAKEGEEAARLLEQAMAEGEAGMMRKAESTGIQIGGEQREIPEDIIAQVMAKRKKAIRGEPTETVARGGR